MMPTDPLVAALSAAHLEGSWSAKMRTYTGPSVLVVGRERRVGMVRFMTGFPWVGGG